MKILSRIYLSVVTVADGYVPQRYNRQWNHPAGPKTIFFWAPLFKWVLVIAGLGDITRPAEKLSLVQSTALLSGYIWARYSLIIIPRNVNLCLVNLFVGLVGSVQLTRIYLYRKSLETPDPKKQE
ncbi:mitochondrial pyruvate carrier 2-like [Ylistrum balloti]|uniref:mitochondrial pyruvate carrier 2-like n=1 Tax=Ylistrum balloti TaxID=509963 RepID=UPI0029059DFA|nr:mitochondrial pyruvate carrier 2-like [Ylistrum balloti]